MDKHTMETHAEEYIKQNRRYAEEVKKFIAYLKQPSVDRISKVAGISSDDVEAFIGDSPQINAIETMARYLESIKSFDDFLMSKEYRISYIIPRGEAFSNFKNQLAKKYQLKERIERGWLLSEEIKAFLNAIDMYFYEEEYHKLGKEAKERYIYWLCLRIYIKMSLLAPAKKSVLMGLKIDDFSYDFRAVSVNGINMRIPNGLRANVIDSLNFIKKETKQDWNQSTKLFDYFSLAVKQSKDNIGTALNAKLYIFLKSYTTLEVDESKTTYSLEKISNSAIEQMINNGTNPAYISRITGISLGQLEIKFYKKQEDTEFDTLVENEINRSIACADYYQYL